MSRDIILILSLSVLACCKAPPDRTAISPESANMSALNRADKIENGPVAFVAARPLANGDIAASALAVLSGQLVIREGCLVVKNGIGEYTQPIFDPARAKWKPTSAKLLFDKKEYSLGDLVEFGGGLIPPHMGNKLANQGVNICENIPLFGVS